MAETMFSTKIMSVQTDKEKEFMNRQFHAMFHKFGITHRHSCLYTPEHMGSVERKYRHVVRTGLVLLASSSNQRIIGSKHFKLHCILTDFLL